MKSDRLFLVAALLVMGAGWGATIPISKYYVTQGLQPFGVLFWQLLIGALLLGSYTLVQGKKLPLTRRHLALYTFVGLAGTLIPGFFSMLSMKYLPAGIMALIMSSVPMLVFPIALLMGQDTFSWKRFFGLALGLVAVGFIVAPEASLPERAMVAFIPLALIGPFCYAIEANVVAKVGTLGVGPIRVLLGAFTIGTILALPLALLTGQWISPFEPMGWPHFAVVFSAVIHAVVYGGYVWLVGRAGSVFAAQVAYLVTGFGLLWSILFLNETYSVYIWLALSLMFVGVFLVQPRAKPALEHAAPLVKDGATRIRSANL
ncbi:MULTISPECIES: DMT family transporter [Falsihalocynthiibacter]|uniref:DMT family transporter n=1 Tax=Falsihalocynthiibacter TaxID=2854182 RepID=UPI0030036DAB